METYFTALSQDPDLPGYGEFEKDAWAFKVYSMLVILSSKLIRLVARPAQRRTARLRYTGREHCAPDDGRNQDQRYCTPHGALSGVLTRLCSANAADSVQRRVLSCATGTFSQTWKRSAQQSAKLSRTPRQCALPRTKLRAPDHHGASASSGAAAPRRRPPRGGSRSKAA